MTLSVERKEMRTVSQWVKANEYRGDHQYASGSEVKNVRSLKKTCFIYISSWRELGKGSYNRLGFSFGMSSLSSGIHITV
jgi:hypothetical protein